MWAQLVTADTHNKTSGSTTTPAVRVLASTISFRTMQD
jgi:hypothetical protein